MKTALLALAFLSWTAASLLAEDPPAKPALIVAVGAGGTEQYAAQFGLWALQWQRLAGQSGIPAQLIGGLGNEGDDKAALTKALEAQSKQSTEPLWIVLIGHGTWDGHNAKFNLRGDDISASEMAELLKGFARPIVIAATFSSSGAWLAPLQGPDRIVLTSTRSGSEENFSRFGEYLPERFADPTADLDKDGQVSVLEAWLAAARKTAEFYANEGRLATEHQLIEDNADGKGTPPDWFQGIRAVKKSKDNASPDGLRAHQIHLIPNLTERTLPAPVRQERDALELEIAKLRDEKSSMTEEVYYGKLEQLLLKLAGLYAD